ncbi:hypothetical protein Q7C36_023075 [Tachysurus vachellii]|uniref:Uncharacterized protein n=1 Tax=Tachysurus vachellii TaxID=175792 RepID=A0AA88IKJ9_TACVA|nr:hypothetical protein Q7C36_023075 [Tachysurus vachellii]
MHLLGTSVLVFLLLPLVFSCKSTKSKDEIYRDYTNIIQKQLNHINLSIQRQMESCPEKRLPNLSSIERISSLSCKRFPKHINGTLQSELLNLTRNIHASLGCPCSTNQTEQALRWPDSQSVQKKFCRLKHGSTAFGDFDPLKLRISTIIFPGYGYPPGDSLRCRSGTVPTYSENYQFLAWLVCI